MSNEEEELKKLGIVLSGNELNLRTKMGHLCVLNLIDTFEFTVSSSTQSVRLYITHEQAEALAKFLDRSPKKTGVLDKNGREICFGDTVRFSDKVEWYRRDFWAKVTLGIMTKEEALAEIAKLPYEERKVESIYAYEWLLSEDIQIYWAVV